MQKYFNTANKMADILLKTGSQVYPLEFDDDDDDDDDSDTIL